VRREVIGDGFAFVGELKESGEVTEVTLDGLAGLVLAFEVLTRLKQLLRLLGLIPEVGLVDFLV
jgi:hypothetical protein